jgi:Asp-tRNA(Asn)/Glu-tRNA(Gln) amidotransferase C subunit
MSTDERDRLTVAVLADFDIGDLSIMAEGLEQGVLGDVVGKIANVDCVGNNLREDSVVGGASRLTLLRLCEGEDEGLVVAKSLSSRVSEVGLDGSEVMSRHTLKATWQAWKSWKRKKAPAGRLYMALSV